MASNSRSIIVGLVLVVSACSDSPVLSGLFGSKSDSILQLVDLTPDVVLGQIALDVTTTNFVDGKGFMRPGGVAVDTSVTPHRLYVADTGNNRVLIFANALTFSAGDEAIAVLGQPDLYHSSCAAADLDTLCGPKRVAVDAAGNVYVADTGNNRVLRYDAPLIPGGDFRADRVFGQPTMTSTACGVVSSTTLCNPTGVAVDGTGRLFVVDTSNHRVVIFPTPAVSSTATIALGQPSLDTGGPNIIEARGFAEVSSIALDKSVTPNRVYVADRGNHRVLGWHSVNDLFSNVPAAVVVGQADFTHGLCNRGGAPSADTLCAPSFIAVDAAGNLIVSDTNNNRVLGFQSPLATSNTTADARWGQSAYSTNSCATELRTLCGPEFVGVDPSGALFVHDKNNGRVLKFMGGFSGDTDPDMLFGAASYTVVGTFSLFGTAALDVSGNLYVQTNTTMSRWNSSPADTTADQSVTWSNSRTQFAPAADGSLWFHSSSQLVKVPAPATNLSSLVNLGSSNPLLRPGAPMALDSGGTLLAGDITSVFEFVTPGDLNGDRVGGQPSMFGVAPNRMEQGGLSNPTDIAMRPSGGFGVSDVDNRRVVIWPSTNVVTGQLPTLRIGASSWTTPGSTFPFAQGLSFDALGNLYVASGLPMTLHRFNAPLVDGALVPSAQLAYAGASWAGLAVDGTAVLFTTGADPSAITSHSVLRIDNAPSTLVISAVLGQPDLAHQTANFVDGRGLNSPASVAFDISVSPHRVYVGDNLNRRILGWRDAASLTSGKAADLVIGQSSFFDVTCAPISATSLCQVGPLAVDGNGRLYALDVNRGRVLIFDSPFTTDVIADAVVGTSSPTAFTETGSILGGFGTSALLAVDDAGNLYVGAHPTLAAVTIYRTPRTTDSVADVTINVGSNVMGLAVDATQGRVYTASVVGQVAFFDSPLTTDTAVDGTFQLDTTGSSARYALVARDGLFWGGANQLALYVSPSSGATPVRVIPLRTEWQCALDSVGSLAVADSNSNRVRVYFVQGRPSATAAIVTPGSPLTADALTVSYVYSDPEGQPQTGTTVRWFADGVVQPAFNNLVTVPAAATTKGQVWTAVVQPHDTVEFGAAVTTAPVTIANTPPVASAQDISPASPVRGSTLSVSWSYADADGDMQVPATVRWFKDNVQQPALDNLTTVPGTLTLKGQVWRVSIVPQDGSSAGAAVEAQAVIQNTAPTASSLGISPASPSSSASLDATWTYSDVDGDAQAGTTVRWFKNGIHQTALDGQTHVPGPLTLNDDWYFTVTPRDGVSFGAVVGSSHVVIGSTAPTATALSIVPLLPRRATASLNAQYTYVDPDGQAEGASTIRWYKNGVQVNTGASITGPFTRGDSWYFTLTACDVTPLCGTVQTSATVTVANTVPVASIANVSPAIPKVTDALQASYTFSDGDTDAEGGSELRWFRNGQEQATYRNVKVLPVGVAKKTELWHFSVTPSDGFEYGATVSSAAVTVANTLPTATGLTLTPAAPTVLSTLSAQHSFTDADDDLSVGTTLRWFKNAVEDSSLQNAIAVPPAKLMKGDQWRFTVTPSDGVGTGAVATSAIVTIQNSQPSVTNVVITPSSPSVGVPLSLSYTFSDVDSGDVESGTSVRWFKNGVEVPAFANTKTIPGTQSVRGDSWRAEVTPSDGSALGAVVSSTPVVIGNHVPSVSMASILPVLPKRLDVLQAVYTFEDVDGDLESGSVIEWYRNGIVEASLADQKSVPAGTAFKREIWNYRVRPKDGTDFGTAELSSPVVVSNTAPVALAGANAVFAPTGVLTRVTVDGSGSTDVDNDVLTFTWSEGATVLGQGSVASFDLPIGSHSLTLTVSDGEASATDVTHVTVGDAPPVVHLDAGFDAPPGFVTVVGQATDSLNRPLSYAWKQIAGAAALDLSGTDTNSLTFFALAAGPRTFELVATAGSSVSAPEVIVVTTANVPPWAEAPPRQVIAVGTTVSVDGRWSDDSNADPLTFRWSGDGLLITEPTQGTTHVGMSVEGEGLLSLVVNDGELDSAPAITSLLAIDTSKLHSPVANAGADAVVDLDSTLVLDGSASFDVDADALSYRWKQVEGPQVTLAFANSSRAQVRFSSPGIVKLSLTVSDGLGSDEDVVSVAVGDTSVNRRARVRVASELFAHVRDTVLLDATASVDPDGDALHFSWRQLSGPQVTLLDASAPRASFVALRPGVLRFELSAWDGALQALSVVTVRVTHQDNHVPIADAGVGFDVMAGQSVTLDGSGSSDEDGDPLRYSWVQLEGPPVVLFGTAAMPQFTPQPKRARYRFQLTVWDAEVPSRPAEVTVEVRLHGEVNARPVAVIGAAPPAVIGGTVTLDGSGSSDADERDVLNYHWSVTGYPTTVGEIVLSDDSSPRPTFTPTAEGAYSFRLIVDDGELSSEPATATVLVGAWPDPGCGCESGGSVAGVPLFIAWLLRRKRRR